MAAETDTNEADDGFWQGTEDVKRNRPAGRRSTVHFVEVKTRTGTTYGTPGEAVTYAKRQKIKKTALTWLQSRSEYFSDISFDVIEICVASGTAKIRWLQHCL